MDSPSKINLFPERLKKSIELANSLAESFTQKKNKSITDFAFTPSYSQFQKSSLFPNTHSKKDFTNRPKSFVMKRKPRTFELEVNNDNSANTLLYEKSVPQTCKSNYFGETMEGTSSKNEMMLIVNNNQGNLTQKKNSKNANFFEDYALQKTANKNERFSVIKEEEGQKTEKKLFEKTIKERKISHKKSSNIFEASKKDEENNFLCDPQFFRENESPRDTKVRDFLKQRVENENLRSLDFETLVRENPGYFSHLFGVCACFKCTCGFCKCRYLKDKSGCKFDLKNRLTTYVQDYQGKRVDPELKAQFEASKTDNPTMIGDKLNDIPHELTYKTIMQRDFPKPLPNYIPKEKKKYSSNDSPFLALTSYQSDYMNWRGPRTYKHKGPCEIPVLKDLLGKFETTYGSSFITPKREEIVNFTKTNRNPFNTNLPFLGETSYSSFGNFKTPKLNVEKEFRRNLGNDELIKSPSHKEHFLTTKANDFKSIDFNICPAKIKEPEEEIAKRLMEKYEMMSTGNNFRTN